jgi:hypothetical protein
VIASTLPRRASALATLLLAAAAGSLAAQEADAEPAADSASTPGAAWTAEVWAGYGNNSTLQLHLGEIAGVDVAFTAIGASRRLAGTSRVELRQTVELLPAVLVSSLSWDIVSADCPTGRRCRVPSGFNSTGGVYGIGATPIGLETRWRLADAAHLFAGGRGGAVWFGGDVPLEGGGRVHYFGGVGAGLRLRVAGTTWLRIGYEAHHLSNANTAPQNPGMDWHVWNVGISRQGR